MADDFTNKAMAFMESSAKTGEPFFAYLPHNTPYSTPCRGSLDCCDSSPLSRVDFSPPRFTAAGHRVLIPTGIESDLVGFFLKGSIAIACGRDLR